MKFSARDFTHPEDQSALDALQAVPFFATCVQMFMQAVPEQFLHGLSMAQKIRLGPSQLPEIYQHLPPVCAALGIVEPELYLEMHPFPNAYTYGDTRPMLTVTSGLVEHLTPAELQTVMAHECGHIVCQHVLYRTMADMLLRFGASILQSVALLSAPLKLALLYWYRSSELSADRAAAVVMRGATPVVNVMIRLAGGSKAITDNVNIDLYTQQAEAYEKLHESMWDKLLQGAAASGQEHPFLAVRTREIVHWCANPSFQALLQRLDTNASSGPQCPGCQQPVQSSWKFCKYCGHATPHTVLASQPGETPQP